MYVLEIIKKWLDTHFFYLDKLNNKFSSKINFMKNFDGQFINILYL